MGPGPYDSAPGGMGGYPPANNYGPQDQGYGGRPGGGGYAPPQNAYPPGNYFCILFFFKGFVLAY